MQTGKEKGIEVFVSHYPAVTKYPAFEGWEGCMMICYNTINIVFCPVVLQNIFLKQNQVMIPLAKVTSLLETFLS